MAEPAADAAASPPEPAPAPRPRRVVVAVLLTLAVLIGFVGMFSVWVNRQALNTDAWTDTSGRLLADPQVQKAVSAYLVDELFSNVDVAGELRKVLPSQAAVVAGPAAAGLQELAGRLAPQLLARPRVQSVWRAANRAAHAQLLTVLNSGGKTVSTRNGEVVLNLRSLVDSLAATLGVEDQVSAVRAKLQGSAGATARALAQQHLGVTLPSDTGRIVIMRSKNLKLAQDVARAIRHIAVVTTALALLLFALAVWLANGWRRVALRRAGWCFIGLGLSVLLLRRVVGNRVIDALVTSESVKPAGHSAWTIGTTLLYDIAIAMFAYGVVIVIAASLAGPTRAAVGLRRQLAPALRFQLASVYGVVALLFLIVVAWGPTPATRKPLGIVLLAALIVLGVELLRRQVAREYPDVRRGETVARWREGLARRREELARRRGGAGEVAPAPGQAGDHLAELERVAALHDRGVLSDEEFASQKRLILGRA